MCDVIMYCTSCDCNSCSKTCKKCNECNLGIKSMEFCTNKNKNHVEVECPVCEGEGSIVYGFTNIHENKCYRCKGTGKIRMVV